MESFVIPIQDIFGVLVGDENTHGKSLTSEDKLGREHRLPLGPLARAVPEATKPSLSGPCTAFPWLLPPAAVAAAPGCPWRRAWMASPDGHPSRGGEKSTSGHGLGGAEEEQVRGLGDGAGKPAGDAAASLRR